MEIIDADKPDRKQIVWSSPTGTGTERFAVWHIGSNIVRWYHPEGIEKARHTAREPLDRDSAFSVANRMRQARGWAEISSELHSSSLYV